MQRKEQRNMCSPLRPNIPPLDYLGDRATPVLDIKRVKQSKIYTLNFFVLSRI